MIHVKHRNPSTRSCQAVAAHAFNFSTWEAEPGGFLSSRPAWSTRVSSSTARATQRNPVSKNQKPKTQNQKPKPKPKTQNPKPKTQNQKTKKPKKKNKNKNKSKNKKQTNKKHQVSL